jgi:four helix bundle protein
MNRANHSYDLEERTFEFAKRLLKFLDNLPQNTINFKLVDQCTRSGTSIGANYREANETDTQKDFLYRARICRKEAKETIYWLRLIDEFNDTIDSDELHFFLQESEEFVKIFSSIINKTKSE